MEEKKDFNEFDDENKENKFSGKSDRKKAVKRGVSLGLCALLAGGLVVGGYQGINYLGALGQAQEVQAADNEVKLQMADGAAEDETTLETTEENTEEAAATLLKSDKNSDSSDDTKSDSDTTDSSDSSEASDSSTTAVGSLDVTSVVDKAMPSIVAISTKSVQEVQNYYGIYSQFGYAPDTEQEVEGSGSGIIIGKTDSEILIATNYHVVEDADTVSVAFVDGNAYEAKVKGFDANKDLAVVSVTLDDVDSDTLDEIAVATIGSSDDLKVGEQVVAIGNALGYGQSVTTGIVSAKNRRTNSDYSENLDSDTESKASINLIQTDAAINPGNSGGALLNMDGEVVGINSAKLASTDVEGIGYAIAISDVTDTLENLMNQKTREKVDNHGVIGITGSSVSSEAAQLYGVPEGVLIREVSNGGAADDAGLQAGDIITEFDGRTVTSIDQLVSALEYYAPGEEVEVVVEVRDGNSYTEKTFTLTLGENTDSSSSDNSSSDSNNSDSNNNDNNDNSDNSNDNNGNNDNSNNNGGDSLFQDWEDAFGGNWQ